MRHIMRRAYVRRRFIYAVLFEAVMWSVFALTVYFIWVGRGG